MINYSKCAERFVKQHYKIIAMLILAVAVIPFLMLTYYSRPCVDDYSYAVDTHALIKKRKLESYFTRLCSVENRCEILS